MSKDKKKIALLNDTLRRTFIGGRIMQTRGVAALPEETREAVLTAVRERCMSVRYCTIIILARC